MASSGGYKKIIGNAVSIEYVKSIRNTLRFMIICSYICIALMFIALFALPFIPNVHDQDGNIHFISHGFITHGVLASVIYGTTSMFITSVRIVSVFAYIDRQYESVCCILLQLISTINCMLTVRYDIVKYPYHEVASLLWILSSIIFFAIVFFDSVFNDNRLVKIIQVIWTTSVITFVLCIIYTSLWSQSSNSVSLNNIAAVFEYITAALVIMLDFMLLYSMHTQL
jgi:hypothetical protein